MKFRRLSLAGLAAGLGLTAVALAQEPAAPAPPRPVPPLTGLDGWVLAGETEGMRLYVKPEPLAGEFARLSARIEEYGATGPFSSVSLEEYDCAANRQRMRSATSYARNNLAGPGEASNEVTPWFEPKPDTLEHALQVIACENGKPRAAQAILAMSPRALPAPAALAIPNTEGWLLWRESPEMTVLSLPAAPVGSRGRAWLRVELHQDSEPGYRSVVSLEEVDCARRRTRTLQETYYPRNGMLGQRDLRAKASGWAAIRPATVDQTLYDSFCDGKTPRATVGGATDPGGVWAWMGVEAMDWIELNRNAEEATFAQKGPAGEYLRLWLRSEWRLPRGKELFLSMTELYEFDCATRRYRIIQRTPYKAHNMTSEGESDTTVAPWAFFTPGSGGDELFRVACGLDDKDASTPIPAAAPAAPVKL